jgi:carboxyl-terminal processing protease
VNNELDGGFSGIGVEFAIIRDTVEVTSVSENGPAYQAGVLNGDQIIKVGDSLVAGTGITSDRIKSLLRGKQNSIVSMTVKPLDAQATHTVRVTRGLVPIYSVDAGLMLDDNTGYIKVNKFSATTYEEFSKALSELKTKGATQLILDLRDNPGGYLDAATSMSDDFLDQDKLIVSTRGRNTARIDYLAKEKGVFEQGKLAILVNEGSASASEVVAGAIQDWDRGIIIGRRTFGKGLVQEQYQMPDGAALRLTTARYYTPSGRSIQRSFSAGRDAYNEDLENRLRDGELTGNDAISPADTTPYYTSGKRIVYGGGGIKPDIYVPYDTARWSDPLVTLAFSDGMAVAVRDYFVSHRAKLHYNSINDFIRSFTGEDQVVNTYLSSYTSTEQSKIKKYISTSPNRNYFKLQVKAQLARYLFQDDGYYSVRLKDDNMVTKAISVMNSPQYATLLGQSTKEGHHKSYTQNIKK